MTYYVNKQGKNEGGKDLSKEELLSLLSIPQHHVLPHYAAGKQEQEEILWENNCFVWSKVFKLFFLISCNSEPLCLPKFFVTPCFSFSVPKLKDYRLNIKFLYPFLVCSVLPLAICHQYMSCSLWSLPFIFYFLCFFVLLRLWTWNELSTNCGFDKDSLGSKDFNLQNWKSHFASKDVQVLNGGGMRKSMGSTEEFFFV